MKDKNKIFWQHGFLYNFNTFEKFKNAYLEHILFSYKKNFHPIEKSNITNDTGWGCMLRCGQMILYQGIQMLIEEDKENLMSFFYDNEQSSFSLHNICINSVHSTLHEIRLLGATETNQKKISNGHIQSS